MSLQVDGKFAFEDHPVFYLFVMVLFPDALVFPQVYVSFNMFYMKIVHFDRGVVYNHGLCSSSDPFAYFHRIVLVASVEICVVFL